VARGSGASGALISSVRRAVQRVSRNQVLDRPRAVTEIKRQSTMERRLTATLLGGFAVLALLLACAGIYGVLSFVTARRTHELGIRVALGASRRDVVWLVLKGGLGPVLPGIALGLLGARALARLIESMLFATSAMDVPNLLAVSALFLAVALAACLVPAWRASRVAPMAALRND
jgi:putative ABC transport system permease protein